MYLRSTIELDKAKICYERCTKIGSKSEKYEDFLMTSYSSISDAIEMLFKGIALKYNRTHDVIDIIDNNISGYVNTRDTRKIANIIDELKSVDIPNQVL